MPVSVEINTILTELDATILNPVGFWAYIHSLTALRHLRVTLTLWERERPDPVRNRAGSVMVVSRLHPYTCRDCNR